MIDDELMTDSRFRMSQGHWSLAIKEEQKEHRWSQDGHGGIVRVLMCLSPSSSVGRSRAKNEPYYHVSTVNNLL